jgi:nucleoside-diphosphate-sugar epimerase
MNCVVLGDGLLGSEIINQTSWSLISRNNNSVDARDFKNWSNLLDEYDTIVNCIAFTKTYENNKKDNWDLNIFFVNELIDYCNHHNKKLIHISTDYLYAGSVPFATEDDIPIPVNTWYGYSKLVGDAIVQLRSNDYLICRLSHKPNPFPYENAWFDMRTNCDSVDVISDLIIKLVNSNAKGVYNVGTEIKSIYDLAKKTNSEVRAWYRPKQAPEDISMNINKLKNKLNENF